MNTRERIITIFGGSKCREGDPEYAQALQVGELLQAGLEVQCRQEYERGPGIEFVRVHSARNIACGMHGPLRLD